MTNYFDIAVGEFHNPAAWITVIGPVPHSPVIWGSIGIPILVTLVAIAGWKIWRTSQQTLRTIKIIDTNAADWNLVQVGLTAARQIISESAQLGSRYTVLLTSGLSSVSARVEVCNIGEAVRMSGRIADKLGLRDSADSSNETKQPIGMHIPYLCPDLWTFWHPPIQTSGCNGGLALCLCSEESSFHRCCRNI